MENGNPEILTNKAPSLHCFCKILLACPYIVNKNYTSNLARLLLGKGLQEEVQNTFLGHSGNKISHLDYCLCCASCFLIYSYTEKHGMFLFLI